MSTIIDAVFTIVLALTATGEQDVAKFSMSFDTRAACQSFRGEKLDYVANLTAADKAGKTFYISECTAVPLTVVK